RRSSSAPRSAGPTPATSARPRGASSAAKPSTTSPTARTGGEGRAEGDQTAGRPRPSLRMNVTTTNRLEGSMPSFSSNGTDANANSEHLVLDELSEALRISKQTLVSWTDRGLIDASLD